MKTVRIQTSIAYKFKLFSSLFFHIKSGDLEDIYLKAVWVTAVR